MMSPNVAHTVQSLYFALVDFIYFTMFIAKHLFLVNNLTVGVCVSTECILFINILLL